MASILTDIKAMIGITEDYTHFDTVLIMHINSALMVLTQLGIGPTGGFAITGSDEEWDDFITDDDAKYAAVKSYMCARVNLLFDTSMSSVKMDLLKQQCDEFEWRLNVAAEYDTDEEEDTTTSQDTSTDSDTLTDPEVG